LHWGLLGFDSNGSHDGKFILYLRWVSGWTAPQQGRAGTFREASQSPRTEGTWSFFFSIRHLVACSWSSGLIFSAKSTASASLFLLTGSEKPLARRSCWRRHRAPREAASGGGRGWTSHKLSPAVRAELEEGAGGRGGRSHPPAAPSLHPASVSLSAVASSASPPWSSRRAAQLRVRARAGA